MRADAALLEIAKWGPTQMSATRLAKGGPKTGGGGRRECQSTRTFMAPESRLDRSPRRVGGPAWTAARQGAVLSAADIACAELPGCRRANSSAVGIRRAHRRAVWTELSPEPVVRFRVALSSARDDRRRDARSSPGLTVPRRGRVLSRSGDAGIVGRRGRGRLRVRRTERWFLRRCLLSSAAGTASSRRSLRLQVVGTLDGSGAVCSVVRAAASVFDDVRVVPVMTAREAYDPTSPRNVLRRRRHDGN